MSVEREALLGALPRTWIRAPFAEPAFTIAYGGVGTIALTVEEGALVVEGRDGADSFTVEFDAADVTLAQLVATFGMHSGYAAAVTDDALAPVLALALMEAPPVDLSAGDAVTLYRWTSPNWRQLEPLRRALRLAVPHIGVAVSQLNLLQAAGFFADLWGLHTGTVRKAGELDDGYTARQLHELLRSRENNQALARILEEDLGVEVDDVVDLEREIFVFSGSPMRGRSLAGRHYNAATVEVRLGGFPGALARGIAVSNAAAGVTVFMTGRFVLEHQPSTYATRTTTLLIGTLPYMQIAHGAIGNTRIKP